MPRPIDEFGLAWSSLSSADAGTGWRAISLAGIGPLSLKAGRSFPGNHEALLIRFPTAKWPAKDKLPEGRGFSVERASPGGDGLIWMSLARKEHGSFEVFAAMASNLVAALDGAWAAGSDEPGLMRLFIGRLRAWQEFMRKGAGPLGAEAEIGLVGELALLTAIIDLGVATSVAVQAWVGPLDGLQDFELGTGAIEVKSTVSAVGFTATIGSLQQLDDSVRQPLFVAAMRLVQRSPGWRLPDAIQALRSQTAAQPEVLAMLADRLIAAGYLDAHAPLYTRAFESSHVKLLLVGPAFPRLTATTAPIGVSRAIYDIDLDKVPGTRLELAEVLKKLGAV
jgi:hypothetical protein